VIAYLITDPEMQFIVQTSSAGIGSSQVGYNANVTSSVSSQGNATTGVSVMTIDSARGSISGASHPFRIVDVYSNFAPPGVNGTDNSSAYNILVVAPNNWDRHAGVAGVST
jgi:hypothetical protein